MLRLALFGCANEPRWREAARRLNDVTIVSAASADDLSLDDLLTERGEPFDGIILAAGPEQVARATMAARCGKHILVSPSSEFGAEGALAAACREQGVCLMLQTLDRFIPAHQTVKEKLDAGKLGKPGLLRIHHWISQGSEADPNRVLGRIDLALWLMGGSPTNLYACERAEGGYLQIHLGFKNGGMAILDFAHELPAGDGYSSLSLIGSRGAAQADDHHNMQLLFGGGRPSAIRTEQGLVQLTSQLASFADAVKQGSVADGADARRAQQVAQAIVISIQERRAMLRTGDRYEPV